MQLASQLKPPLFDEQSDSWADFVWEWEEYWRSLTDGGGTVSEGDKLKVFGQCLGRDLQDTITYLKRSSGAVAFEHVFTYFEPKYGLRKGLGIQAAWKALKIPAQGALNLQILGNFASDSCRFGNNFLKGAKVRGIAT